jgi:hypothetical protein
LRLRRANVRFGGPRRGIKSNGERQDWAETDETVAWAESPTSQPVWEPVLLLALPLSGGRLRVHCPDIHWYRVMRLKADT